MSSEIAALEAEIKEYRLQLETVQLGLQADPDSAELAELKSELEQVIALSQSAIDDLRPPTTTSAPVPAAKPASAPGQEKWKRENHPKFREEAKAAAEDEAVLTEKHNFKVNDTVLAKWYSGDKGFYPARITSITGSSNDPVYIVKFKTYDTVETLRSRDIKPVSNKRKADGAFTGSSPSTPTTPSGFSPASSSGHGVISAGPNIDAEAKARMDREKAAAGALGDEDKPKKPKKIKATKELEKGKAKWQDWAAKGPKGVKKKESMFRTPEGVHGRVGFTGSGQSMRKDPTRSRHIYQTGGEDDAA